MGAIEQNFKVYSKSTDGAVNLTKNFKVREFACKDGTDPVIINTLLPHVCQAVRNWFGYAFTPNSAYRTVAHNAKPSVGGAAKSNHIYGMAADIPAKSGVCTPKELYDFLDRLCGDSCELGLYSWGVHIAVQDTKERFTDASYKG